MSTLRKLMLGALCAATLGSALPASAHDGGWRRDERSDHGWNRDSNSGWERRGPPQAVYVQPRPVVYERRPVAVERPVYVEQRPVIRDDAAAGLIIGGIIGAIIGSHIAGH